MRHILLTIVIFPVLLHAQFVPSGTNTIDDLKLLSRDLRSNQRVLYVMFAPGDEDIGALTSARLTWHAGLHLAYLTNGEGRPDGEGVPYPNQLAARWREKAYRVAHTLGAGHTYLNLPYIDAASGQENVRLSWPADTVRKKLRDLIQDQKPDAIIVTGLEAFPEEHPVVTTLLSDITSSMRRALRSREWVPLQIAMATGFRADRNASTAEDMTAKEQDVRAIYGQHGGPEERRRIYAVYDWKNGTLGETIAQSRLFPARRVPQNLAVIDSSIQAFAGRLIRLRTVPVPSKRADYLVSLVDIMQKLDMSIAEIRRDADEERRFLLDWKLSLEQIRGLLLGVRVWWSVSENILTDRQITVMKIDSISGLDEKGRTEVFFPTTLSGWVVNETSGSHFPYSKGVEYRLFSIKPLPQDLPRSMSGLDRSVFGTPWYAFIVHQASTAEHSFSFRIDLGIIGAPKFSAEVLTPIVRAVDGEEVVYRLTNHSRDGVSDVVYIAEEFVQSDRKRFRLAQKDALQQDTLILDWTDDHAGSYLIDLLVGGEPVANVLARSFPVRSTMGRRVDMIGLRHASALYPALRRLGYSVKVIDPSSEELGPADQERVILVDESIHLAGPDGSGVWPRLRQAAEAGARVVVFSQRADVLASSGLFPSFRFATTFDADTSYSVVMTGQGELLREPNDLSESTWDGWIQRVASNRIQTPGGAVVEHARFEGSDLPVIVTVPAALGTITYVDLNLSPQWANVLPAAYELLANIVENNVLSGEEQ